MTFMTLKFFLDTIKTRFDYTNEPVINKSNCSDRLQNCRIDVVDIKRGIKYYGRLSLWIRVSQKDHLKSRILLVNLIRPYNIDSKFLKKIDYLNWRVNVDEDTIRPICIEKIKAMRPSNPYPCSWDIMDF